MKDMFKSTNLGNRILVVYNGKSGGTKSSTEWNVNKPLFAKIPYDNVYIGSKGWKLFIPGVLL